MLSECRKNVWVCVGIEVVDVPINAHIALKENKNGDAKFRTVDGLDVGVIQLEKERMIRRYRVQFARYSEV